MKTKIWSTRPELVSVVSDPTDQQNLVVSLTDQAYVKIDLKANDLDPEGFLSSLQLSRVGDDVRAVAVLDGVDVAACLETGESDWFLSDHQSEIYKYLGERYGAANTGSVTWENLPVSVQADVTDQTQEDRLWMTVNTADVFSQLWSRESGISQLREDILDGSFSGGIRTHIDSV